MPILNTMGYKQETFLGLLSQCVSGEKRYGESPESPAVHPIVYFGGGYWRGLWSVDKQSIRLINPSLSRDEERKVEAGVAILLHMRFIETQEERE